MRQPCTPLASNALLHSPMPVQASREARLRKSPAEALSARGPNPSLSPHRHRALPETRFCQETGSFTSESRLSKGDSGPVVAGDCSSGQRCPWPAGPSRAFLRCECSLTGPIFALEPPYERKILRFLVGQGGQWRCLEQKRRVALLGRVWGTVRGVLRGSAEVPPPGPVVRLSPDEDLPSTFHLSLRTPFLFYIAQCRSLAQTEKPLGTLILG